MNKALAAGALLGFGFAGTAHAQQTITWSAPQTVAQARQATYFPMGTPLTLVTRTQVSTKVNKPGDRILLYVAEPLSYRGQVVVPVGSVAVGEVAQADRNGHLGKKGKLAISLVSIETPSGPVRLTGDARDEGRSGLAASIATIAFVSPLGALIHGTSAQLPAGTFVQAYLGEPLRFFEQPAVAFGQQAQPDATLPARFVPGGPVTASR